MDKKIFVLIKGPYPPPIGGISIYIKRLLNQFDTYRIKYSLIKESESNSRKILIKQLFGKHNIFHVNSISIKSQILLFLGKVFGKRAILNIHGGSIYKHTNDDNKNKLYIWLLVFLIKRLSAIIVVNENLRQYLIEIGIKPNKVLTIPAFIKPDKEETATNILPKFFHDIRKTHTFLITANAFKISFHEGEDLYGIDLSIELMKRLIDKGYNDVGFIYVIPEIGDHEYYQKMQELVLKHKLTDHFHFYTQPVPYPAVINLCDLFIRPTNTDGYGVSIAEAISLQVPAIASDVCPRPEGTLLFENRNMSDLEKKTEDIINNYDIHKSRIRGVSYEDNAQKIAEVYNKVLRT